MTPIEARDVLDNCRIAVFVAQSFAVRHEDRSEYDDEDDTGPVRGALEELTALLPIADEAADEDLRRGCAALAEATELVETSDVTKMGRRERKRLSALDREGVEHLSSALTRLQSLADLGSLRAS